MDIITALFFMLFSLIVLSVAFPNIRPQIEDFIARLFPLLIILIIIIFILRRVNKMPTMHQNCHMAEQKSPKTLQQLTYNQLVDKYMKKFKGRKITAEDMDKISEKLKDIIVE